MIGERPGDALGHRPSCLPNAPFPCRSSPTVVREHLDGLVDAAGPLGPVAFVVAYVALTVAFVPGTIPSLAAGALFGAVWGTVLTLVGATLGAALAYEVARRLGRERLQRVLGPRALAADAWVGERGLRGVLALRLVPVVPFNALNYAFGLSSVGRRDHLIGTAVGIVPGTVAFVALGDAITEPGSTGFFLSLGAVLLLVLVSVVAGRRTRVPA